MQSRGAGGGWLSSSFGDVENFLNATPGAAPDISSIESAAKTMQTVDEITAQVKASSVMT